MKRGSEREGASERPREGEREGEGERKREREGERESFELIFPRPLSLHNKY